MSALIATALPYIPVRTLQRVGLRAQLSLAEGAIDEQFTRAASLRLDRAVFAYEAAHDRSTPRGLRRVA